MPDWPEWLPEMVSVNGEWSKVLQKLYAIFDRDFRQTARCFEGRSLSWDTRVLDVPYEEGFWHLITRLEHRTSERLFDPRRAERLPWCGPTLSHSDDIAVRVWDYSESHGKLRTYVWLKDWDYVVILEKRDRPGRSFAFLVTAFHVDGESRRRDLCRKYAQRVE